MQNVVILGMHRSGTSMLASYLQQAGLQTGEPEELMPAQADNPEGFHERLDVVEYNDQLLRARGGSWMQPPSLDDAMQNDETQALNDIVARLPIPYVLKDPRMMLTWPIWREQLQHVVVVYLYREPLAVAHSLKRRHGFPLAYGLALWEYYNASILQTLAGSDALYVAYEDVARDTQQVLGQLINDLTLRGVRCQLPESHVFNSRYNHAPGVDETQVLLTDSQRELQAYCESLGVQGFKQAAPFFRPKKLRCQLTDYATAFAPLGNAIETRAQAQQMEYQRDELQQVLDALNEEHDALSQTFIKNEKTLREAQESEKNALLLAEQAQQKALEFEKQCEKRDEQLSDISHKLVKYDQSPLGSVGRFAETVYKLATLRRGMHSSYDEALEAANEYLVSQGEVTTKETPSKFSMLAGVCRYVLRHPAGSLRSFSFSRLRRAAAVFLKASPDDLEVWVNSRFPEDEGSSAAFDVSQIDASYDELTLHFLQVDKPRVSIVIPVYNNYRMTVQCLQSIKEHTPSDSYEVIIADDASSDLTQSITERVHNVVVTRAEKNQGFLANCNRAADLARGEFVLFLNNDTAVCEGWLEPLLALMDSRTDAGIVGPKLLFADGRLQEAGGIVWRDGSAWNFGRCDDAGKPAYNYVKSVDYISGACLMIRRSLWRQLDGFDERYAPAYYEDTDIAFRARELGFEVLYQPLSQVFHFEGVSNGTDVASGLKQYQVRNQHVFCERHQSVLMQQHFENGQKVFVARDRTRAQRSVLIIDHYVPHYDQDAGSRSTFMYTKLLLDMGYKVLFLGANYFPHKPYTQTLQQMGVEVLVGESMARNQDRWLQENAQYIDAIYLHRPHIAEQLLDSLEKMTPRPRIIYFGHDLHYLRVQREAEIADDDGLRRSAMNWKRRELAVFERVDKIYYPSQIEVDEVSRQCPELSVRAIPLYALPLSEVPSYDFNERRDLLFVGGFNHPPNVDGLCWFVETVLPLIAERCDKAHLHVVGSNPSDAVLDLQSENVTVYGYLSDDELDALYQQVRAVVVPLRFGAGVKGKVLEAIQKGLPLVTTSIGAEGIPEPETVMSVVDDADNFADEVVSLMNNEQKAIAKLPVYPEFLQRHFSQERAKIFIQEDFGSPVRFEINESNSAKEES